MKGGGGKDGLEVGGGGGKCTQHTSSPQHIIVLLLLPPKIWPSLLTAAQVSSIPLCNVACIDRGTCTRHKSRRKTDPKMYAILIVGKCVENCQSTPDVEFDRHDHTNYLWSVTPKMRQSD